MDRIQKGTGRMKKIEEVDCPQVGKFYLVACVLNEHLGWLPVVGNWHEDSDIGINVYHYHYDVRFFTERYMNRDGKSAMTRIATEAANVFVKGTDADKNNPPKVVYKRRMMRREMPDFPDKDYSFKKPKLLIILEEKFKDVKMICMTCPHRGMRLKGLPTKDGTVVCNGHGLKWDLATGKVIPR
jgi:hypothetical protein